MTTETAIEQIGRHRPEAPYEARTPRPRTPLEIVGQKIYEQRARYPMYTLKRVAQVVGISPTKLRLIEAGKQDPSYLQLCSIAAALNCTIDDLTHTNKRYRPSR